MNGIRQILTRAFVGAIILNSALPPRNLEAAEIFQTQSVPENSNWNEPAHWGGHPVQPGNDYVLAPIGDPGDLFSLNGTTWRSAGWMRDAWDASSTFGGDSLHLPPQTALLGKVENGGTSTANIVFDGGIIVHGGFGSSHGQSGTLAGTISFGTGTDLAAIAVYAAGKFTFNVASKIVGDSSDTLQLTMFGSKSTNHMNVTGDLNGFAGTFYVSTAERGVARGSSFSIQSSAPRARVVLVTSSTNFQYNLVTSVRFGSLTVNGRALSPGTYKFADLNALAPGAFHDFGGTITVGENP